MPVAQEDDVVLVRRKVREIAQARGFSTFAVAALTTATSELTRNVFMHAGSGKAIIEEIEEGSRFGIRVVFSDEGPGIANVEAALAGGNSTASSLGLGLSGSKRLVDAFSIKTAVGKGTTVEIIKWAPY
jgi:serine/threonine-protein kinase RsbT